MASREGLERETLGCRRSWVWGEETVTRGMRYCEILEKWGKKLKVSIVGRKGWRSKE